MRKLEIELLYLDLDVCTRCQGAEKNLEEAISDVKGVLEATGSRSMSGRSWWTVRRRRGNSVS